MIPAGSDDTTRDDVNDAATDQATDDEDPFASDELEALVDDALDDADGGNDAGDDELADNVEAAFDEEAEVAEHADDNAADDGKEDEQPRDAQGKFAPKSAADTKAAPTDGTAAGTTPEDATKNNTAQAAAPKWEPLSINADKETVAIDEAKVSRNDGHVFLAIPEAKYARFQQRIARGVVGEKLWRQLDQGIRELEARKNAPPPPSDAEIEARLTLEAIKPYLADLLDEKDVDLLAANIKLAQREARDTYAQAEQTRLTQAAAPQWEELQVNTLAEQMVAIVRNAPELAGLTPQDLEDVYTHEFLPYRNSLVFREGGDMFANTELMYGRLKIRAAARQAGPASGTSAVPAPSTAPVKTGHPTTTAQKGTAANAERFNRGVDAAPRTTSLKANRSTRPGTAATRAPVAAGSRRPAVNPSHQAEDKLRRSTRNWLNSDSLDFDDGEE